MKPNTLRMMFMGLAVVAGIAVASRPWFEQRDAAEQNAKTQRELHTLMDERAELAAKEIKTTSDEGKREYLRERGYQDAGEQPLESILPSEG